MCAGCCYSKCLCSIEGTFVAAVQSYRIEPPLLLPLLLLLLRSIIQETTRVKMSYIPVYMQIEGVENCRVCCFFPTGDLVVFLLRVTLNLQLVDFSSASVAMLVS